MNASKDSVDNLIKDLLTGMDGITSEVLVCAPFPYLAQVELLIQGSKVMLGAQNLNTNSSGAYTGEVSADMIKDFGARHVIVGHSERRSLYGETSAMVAEKTKAALNAGLTPLLCIGESIEQRDSGNTEVVIEKQLSAVIELVGIEAFNQIIIAYEPVWAIGTGLSASPNQAQGMHKFIREKLVNNFSDSFASKIPILYGGSVKPGSANDIFANNDVDGGLIGGASLKSQDFSDIINSI